MKLPGVNAAPVVTLMAPERSSVRTTDVLNYSGKPTWQPIKILFLGAAPSDQVRMALGREVKEIERSLRESDAGRRFELRPEWAVRPTDLQAIILRHQPQIVHFSGHGSESGELSFEDHAGMTRTAPVEALGRLFGILNCGIRCVVLNACYSATQAEVIQRYVDCVIGMKNTIEDPAAIAFASSFYLGLGHGESVKRAFDLGCIQIELAGIGGADLPALLSRPGVEPDSVTFVPVLQTAVR
jgi:hypothetical protein